MDIGSSVVSQSPEGAHTEGATGTSRAHCLKPHQKSTMLFCVVCFFEKYFCCDDYGRYHHNINNLLMIFMNKITSPEVFVKEVLGESWQGGLPTAVWHSQRRLVESVVAVVGNPKP